jgi:hypothetical protein
MPNPREDVVRCPDDWINMRASATCCESTSARCERARRCSASGLLPRSSGSSDPGEQLTADSRKHGKGCSLTRFTTPRARHAHAGGIHRGDPSVAARTQGEPLRDGWKLYAMTPAALRGLIMEWKLSTGFMLSVVQRRLRRAVMACVRRGNSPTTTGSAARRRFVTEYGPASCADARVVTKAERVTGRTTLIDYLHQGIARIDWTHADALIRLDG